MMDYKLEWELSEKAHDITLEQLRQTQEQRNIWRELCEKLLKEMDAAEWCSPLQDEAHEIFRQVRIREDIQSNG